MIREKKYKLTAKYKARSCSVNVDIYDMIIHQGYWY